MKKMHISLHINHGEQSGCSHPNSFDIQRYQHTMRAITEKWKIKILCSLIEGPLCFDELRRRLAGITQHMLTEQLRALTGNGIVIWHAFPEIPPRQEYGTTQAGSDAGPPRVRKRAQRFMMANSWRVTKP